MAVSRAALGEKQAVVPPASKGGPPRRFTQPVNDMTVDEALAAFPSPGGETVKILRPTAVYSAQSYSVPMAVPIGPAYVAAMAEVAGYRTDVIDGIGEGLMDVRVSDDGRFKHQGLTTEQIVERIGPDTKVLGVSMMFTQGWVQNRTLIERIKQTYPDMMIVAGGEHPTALTEYVLRDCPAIEYVLTGEGELSFIEFLHHHFTGGDPGSMQGIAYIDGDGRFVQNGLGRRIVDFANLPRPAWHLCHVENFFTGTWTHGIPYGRNMLILATRGCPYQCTFCSNPFMWTTRYLMRPAVEVVDEVEWLIAEYGANAIDFADLTAVVKKEWVLEFCAELKRRKIDIVWQLPSGTRSEALDESTLQSIYDAGCRLLTYAPESGSEESLRLIKKKLSLDNLTASLRTAIRIGHNVKINLIVGFPHERRRHCWKTIFYGMRCAWIGVHDCLVSVFTPYPGSELFEQLRADGTIPAVDDGYFDDLLLQFDLTIPRSFCKHLPGWESAMYRIVGMGLFYLTSYLRHPSRGLRLLSVLWKKDFQPHTVIEQRVNDLLVRGRLQRGRGKGPGAAAPAA